MPGEADHDVVVQLRIGVAANAYQGGVVRRDRGVRAQGQRQLQVGDQQCANPRRSFTYRVLEYQMAAFLTGRVALPRELEKEVRQLVSHGELAADDVHAQVAALEAAMERLRRQHT